MGSCRRELLDHIIALNERHLRRLCPSSFLIIMTTRLILACSKKRLAAESALRRPGRVIAYPRLGGLHHRYDRAA